eukprot:g9579.t1
MDAVGVMNYVNSHPVLKTCKVCLLPFCVSGVAFMKANTLHPEKFKNVVAWATTNIFHGPTIMSNRPYMFGLGNDIKITAQRISAKPYAPDVKVPILYCDVMHDVLDYHEASCPDIFAEPQPEPWQEPAPCAGWSMEAKLWSNIWVQEQIPHSNLEVTCSLG